MLCGGFVVNLTGEMQSAIEILLPYECRYMVV